MSVAAQSGPWCSAGLHQERLDEISWLVVDLETSGLDPNRHTIREYAACSVSAHGEISKTAAWSDAAPDAAGFGDGFVKIAAELESGAILAAHNIAFDLAFLAMHARAPAKLVRPSRWLCTMRMLSTPQSLDALAAGLGVPVVGRHTATGDAHTLAAVLVTLLRRARARDVVDVEGMVASAPVARVGSSIASVPSSAVAGWAGIRAALDHVVPSASVSREQRTAFAAAGRVLLDRRFGPTHPVEHDAVVATLRGAGITASTVDVLVSEIA